ncbi:selenocysteine-specific translation elongation factor [Chloroflexi bacterium TSY]|nr:selenocysteine-specific translation elongation factor [Chloroflexi bacterium TSY]
MRVIGTAGHVDHGKSTLVQALTGIDPDRLQEEKARGMTIDLGFAWIELPILAADADANDTEPLTGGSSATLAPSESVGIVDVPGHIDFIKNMLAGVGSIDAAVLVIAADESVMPQTREHLAILDLLAVPTGVIALTKTDLIDDPEWLDLVELDIAELLQNTRLADAPIVRVSAISGEGLDELRLALAHSLAQLAPRRNRARPRLPIDRIFSLSGFGTVVTGTLSDGHFAVGDLIEVLPSGLSARIRGLQTHKKQVWEGQPGSRLAINLSDIGTDELRRGEVVVKPDTIRSTLLADASFRLLPDASKPLVHNQAIDFFSGAAEIPARVRLLGTETLEPGQSGWLQLRLERPTVVTAGDRYILRQPSPSVTLGGGVILSPHPRRRWRRFDPVNIARLETLARGAPDEILLETLARAIYLVPNELMEQSGLDLEIAQDALQQLDETQALKTLSIGNDDLLLTLDIWQQVVSYLSNLVEAFHTESPLRRGIPRGEARSRLESLLMRHSTQTKTSQKKLTVRIFNAMIEAAQGEGKIAADDHAIWQIDFQVNLTLEQQQAVDQLLEKFASAPFAPPNTGDTLRLLDQDEELLEHLIESEQLVRFGGGVLFRKQDFEAAKETVVEFAREHGTVTLAQARDLLQTSRKYVQAILEEMDAQRITRRNGDARILRSVGQ